MGSAVAVVTDSTAYLPPGLAERHALTVVPLQVVIAGTGASAIVSVHLSAAMSGTVEAARLAAEDAPVPVRVVDSGAIGLGLGFAALSAAAAALEGASPEDVVAAAERLAEL